MAEVTKANPVYVVPTQPTKGAGILPVPPGQPPQSYNMGGIVIGGVAGSQGPFQGPGIRPPTGMTVRIRGNPANAGNVYVSLIREDAQNMVGDIIAPNTEIIYPVDNLASLWFFCASAGDAVTISIRNE